MSLEFVVNKNGVCMSKLGRYLLIAAHCFVYRGLLFYW